MKLTQAGIDIGKNVSQIHYIDAASGEIINRPLKRVALLKYFANRGPFLIGIKACGGSQHLTPLAESDRSRSQIDGITVCKGIQYRK
ncbi:hypothetical protein [Paraburkholderia silvatlantica]|uniref:Transposase n=1 Tax=Paraburkholderia silvatlantica TaxID=321895 RepID=A0A2U1AAF6_9BURK|nr:hypothetical protein [Paraburkholderia silvatlantica]PVY31139.1 hypothetical protein C7411_112164 [Paraburkholderia silvatlantica]PXW37276.1 hypothetical protein C7413_112165 [Paraburkholderia silvatlantica]PYE19580.1 hypothetical protein C7410_11920 [Paraburkholderia silvatlantica]TDQ77484.1 hypothetical protein C7412_13419 [Paraburkholderia silvatlantica]